MNDKIILPDDKTIEKMAKEYAKIKAKTFSTNAVEVLNAKKHKYTLIPQAEFDYSIILKDITLAILLAEHSLLLLRQINSTMRNPNEKILLRKSITERQSIIKKLKNIDLHGRTLNYSLSFPKYYNLSPNRQVFLNQFLILETFDNLLCKLPFGKFKKQFISIKKLEDNLTIKILLFLQ